MCRQASILPRRSKRGRRGVKRGRVTRRRADVLPPPDADDAGARLEPRGRQDERLLGNAGSSRSSGEKVHERGQGSSVDGEQAGRGSGGGGGQVEQRCEESDSGEQLWFTGSHGRTESGRAAGEGGGQSSI